MTEQEMEYLVEEVGLSEHAARLRLRDRDLWLLDPGQRYDDELQGEDGVRMWEEAVTITYSIANIVRNGPGTIEPNPAITQLVWDLDLRAQEALRRARRRALDGEAGQIVAAEERRRREGGAG